MTIVFPPLFHDIVSVIRILVHSHLAMFSLIVFLLDWLGISLSTSLMIMSFFISMFLGYIALKVRRYLIKNKLKMLFKFDKSMKSCQLKKYLFSYIFPKISSRLFFLIPCSVFGVIFISPFSPLSSMYPFCFRSSKKSPMP